MTSDEARQALRARLDTTLRAERAFGVSSVIGTIDLDAAMAAPESPAATSAETADASADATRPPTRRPRQTSGRTAQPSPPEDDDESPEPPTLDLFGNPVVKPAAGIGADLEPFDSPPQPRGKRIELLGALDANEVTGCTKCKLCENRTNTVFGEGDPEADLLFIGEGPGENEDLSGRPFVGKAGGLLDKMIAGMKLSRDDVYIANIVKCRPPGNRAPTTSETATCTPYLHEQIDLIRPKVIVTLGLPATRHLLGGQLAMGKMRGQFHTWRGIKVMPTYHPAYLLRSYTRANREAVWGDLKLVMAALADGASQG